MVYVELSREKIFPLAVIVSLIITASGAFILFDAFTQFTDKTSSMIMRERSKFTYWLLYKAMDNSAEAFAPHASSSAESVPILLYHGETERAGNMPLRVFVDQMRALKKAGWQTITVDQFRDFMKNGASLPDKSFLLTFDDGRRETFYPADPVLKDLGFNAVMYVVTGFSLPRGSRPHAFYLNRSELAYMVESGRWELQSHGDQDHFRYRVQSTTDLSLPAETVDGHFMSNKFWNDAAGRFETDQEFEERIRSDLRVSKEILEDSFGKPIYSYAFPFNDYGQESVNFPGAFPIVSRVVPSEYTFAMYQHFTGNGDSFNYPDPDTYMIRRIEPENDMTGEELIDALNAGRAKQLPYASETFGDEWQESWGLIERGDRLIISAAEDTAGASAFLNGTGSWKNYLFEIDANKVSGDSISLLARNHDDTSYVGCTFGKEMLTIEKQLPGVQINLARVPITYRSGRAHLGLSVRDSTLTCYFNGAPLESATFTEMPRGGIGVEVWDPQRSVARSELDRIRVSKI